MSLNNLTKTMRECQTLDPNQTSDESMANAATNQLSTSSITSTTSTSLRDISRLKRIKARIEKGTSAATEDTKIGKLLICEACPGILVPHDGYMVCKQCGLYQSKDIDASQEWRNLDGNDKGSDPCRVSLPNNTLMPETSVGTMVVYGNKRTANSHIIRTMNNWKMLNYKDSSILKRFKYITTVCKNANVFDCIIEEIKVVFYKISMIKSTRRTKLQALMAVSVIIGHHICGYEKDHTEVAKMFDLDIKILRKMVKEYELIWKDIQDEEAKEQAQLVQASIEEESSHPTGASAAPQPVDDTQLTPDKKLDSLDKEFRKKQDEDNVQLKKALMQIQMETIYYPKVFMVNDWINERNILTQHIPKSRYACIIHLISEMYALNIKKSDIILVCDTSNVTINKCYNKLLPYYDQLVDLLDVK